jgi:archaellum component FlaC
VNQAELDAIYARLDDISAQLAKVDRELDEVAGETISVSEQPAPDAETAEAEVSKTEPT